MTGKHYLLFAVIAGVGILAGAYWQKKSPIL
jgi:hypothetical protein